MNVPQNIWKEQEVKEYFKVENTELSLLHPLFHHLLGDVNNKRIADYGCGEGKLLWELIHRGAIGYGYDISSAMTEKAKERLGENAELAVIESAKIPLPCHSLEAVVSNLVFMMVPSVNKVNRIFQDINRVLIPNGTFTFCISHPCFLDQKFSFYYNQFPSRFNYLKEGEEYNFVLIDNSGVEINNSKFRDYNYSLETYLNLLTENGFHLCKTIEVKTGRDAYPPYLILHSKK